MKRIIELDVNDIKKLIYEKYGVKPKDIEWECREPDNYYDPEDGFVTFRFEEKNDNDD